jgi:hypothetical protein
MNRDETALRSAIASLSTAGSGKLETAKELTALSERHPELLYPVFDAIVELLDAPNKLVQWAAIRMIANMAVADRDDRITRIIEGYLAPISGPVMITAGNTIKGAVKIAGTHKHLTDRIVRAILAVEHARYQTDECRNLAIGHAIAALGTAQPGVRRSERVMAFVRRQTDNGRPATRKKAERFLKLNSRPP